MNVVTGKNRPHTSAGFAASSGTPAGTTATWGVTGYVMTGLIGVTTIDTLLKNRQRAVGFQPATSVVGPKVMRAALEDGGVFGQMTAIIP